jgi:tetratricopeptide (TPR) repeat protein
LVAQRLMIASVGMSEEGKAALVLAREAYAERDFDRADALLRAQLHHFTRFADVHNMLGVIAHGRSNLALAEHHLREALRINANYTEAALNLTVTYNDMGRYEDARALHRDVRTRSGAPSLEQFARGQIANLHAVTAQAYVDAHMPREAIRELEKAVALAPGFADLQVKLGGLLRDQNDLIASRCHYQAALARKPNYVPAHLGMGQTLQALGDADGARTEWTRAQELEPTSSLAKMYLRTLK